MIFKKPLEGFGLYSKKPKSPENFQGIWAFSDIAQNLIRIYDRKYDTFLRKHFFVNTAVFMPIFTKKKNVNTKLGQNGFAMKSTNMYTPCPWHSQISKT